MKTFLKFLAVLIVFLLCVVSPGSGIAKAAPDKLTFGANIRFRYEFQDNFNQLYYGADPAQGSASDGYLFGRFRAGFDYNPCENIHLALWMQDAEAWDVALADSAFYSGNFGMENNPNKDRWELWDTYLGIRRFFDFPLSLKAGRQRIFYGNNRVFGPGEWGNSGRWIWDAVKLSYKFERGFMDAYYGRTQLHEPDKFSPGHRHGFESFGIYGHYKLLDTFFYLVLEPFFMTKTDDHDRYRGEDQRIGEVDSYYWGLRACGKSNNGLGYDFTYIRQSGDYSHDHMDACGYHLLLAYTFQKIKMEPCISIEYSFASGDSNPGDGDRETFDGAFGARDKMYGRMNLFHWRNIKDAQINLKIQPGERLCIKTAFHKFRLAEREDAWYLNAKAYRDKSGASGDEVGRELDIVATIDLSAKSQIQVGFGHFWPDEFAREQASRKESNWVFCQWMYKFSQGIL